MFSSSSDRPNVRRFEYFHNNTERRNDVYEDKAFQFDISSCSEMSDRSESLVGRRDMILYGISYA